MKILNLMEDTKGNPACTYQHGLSFYIETQNHKILLDTGANGDFIKNAEVLGVNLEAIDTVVISHGHYDHTGGLLDFCKCNTRAKIYMHALAGRGYYHVNAYEERYIGINTEILNLENLILVQENMKIDEELSLFTGVTGRILWPKGNLELKCKLETGEFVQDTFLHEQYLVIQTEQTHWLFSGCAHNGILNIMEAYCQLYGMEPDYVVSGFHMMQKQYQKEDLDAIRQTGQRLKDYHTMFYTGHCTGEEAYAILKEEMGARVNKICCGEEVPS